MPPHAPPSTGQTRRSRFSTTFKDIDFGEDDANIEYEISMARDTKPVFLQAYFDHPSLGLSALKDGHKYFVLGQKGTGKTALLRKLQAILEGDGAITSFMIFRDEVASKEELDKFGSVFAINVNDVKKIYHHLYTLERLILLVIASKLPEAAADHLKSSAEDKEADSEEKKSLFSVLKQVVSQPLSKVVEIAISSVGEFTDVVSVDPSKLAKGAVKVDASVHLRKMNERLAETCVKSLKSHTTPIYVFIDEIHFTYRSGEDHDQDASLVRDLIRSIRKLNLQFAAAKVRCKIYAALRSEFLSHPLISAAELHPTLTAYGAEISWATFPASFSHPMFEIGARRVDVSTQSTFTGQEFMKACFANFTQDDAAEFVQSTWSKPRDMIRFLRTCREMFPDLVTLSKSQYSSVFHRACIKGWKEVETALTSFLTTKGVEQVTKLVATHSSASLEKGNIGKIEPFLKSLAPIAKQQTQVGAITEADTLFRILYMLGVIYTTRKKENGDGSIVHSFHRGQENPDMSGLLAIHRGVAKAFS